MKTILKFGILTFLLLFSLMFISSLPMMEGQIDLDNFWVYDLLVLAGCNLYGINYYLKNEMKGDGYNYFTGLIIGVGITFVNCVILGSSAGVFEFRYAGSNFLSRFSNGFIGYLIPGIIVALVIPLCYRSSSKKQTKIMVEEENILDSNL